MDEKIQFVIPQRVDLMTANPPMVYTQALERYNNGAHEWQVHVVASGQSVDLTGCMVVGYAARSDKKTVRIKGKATGSVASVVFDSAFYAINGEIAACMELADSDGRTLTIARLFCTVSQTGTDSIIDPSGEIPSLDNLMALIDEMKTGTANAADAADRANEAAENADLATERADDAAKAIEGMTVSAQSAAAPGAAISERDGVKHIVFDLVTPRITFEVETGAAGTNVELEQSGTPENPVVKLTIPRGDTGNIDGLDYYAGNPAALGEATPGTANGVARGNHVHPMPTAEQVGARPSTWTPTAEQVGARPSTWTPSAEDVGARPSTWMPTAEQVGARPSTWTPSAEDVGALEKNAQAVDSAKLGGNAPEYYMPDYGRGAVLWEGEWSSGVITVPNTDRYTGFQIIMVDISSTILALKNDGKIRGIGGYSSSSTAYSYHFSANCNGDEWTFSSCKSITHAPSGDHGDSSERAVAKIVGLF